MKKKVSIPKLIVAAIISAAFFLSGIIIGQQNYSYESINNLIADKADNFYENGKQEGNAALRQNASDVVNLAVLKNTATNTPFGDIKLYRAQDEKGIAVLIPQNHRYPGAAPSDSRNDSAEITQNQIYQIVEFLHNRYGIDLIMIEGEMFGEVPPEKISALREKVGLRDKFSWQVAGLKKVLSGAHLDEESEKIVFGQAGKIVASLDREIILSGAAFVFKAKGYNVNLLGTENKDTYDQCAAIIKNYIYQKDRLAECQQNKIVNGRDVSSEGAVLERFRALNLAMAGSAVDGVGIFLRKDFDSELEVLKSKSSILGLSNIQNFISEISMTYDNIKKLSSEKDSNSVQNENTYGKNPYVGVSNVNQLSAMIDESEKNIQSMVIDRRNRETAINFEKALAGNNEQVGIIQYGAGHEQGLVSELNKLDITVVVIKPSEVLRREKSRYLPPQLAAIKKLIQDN